MGNDNNKKEPQTCWEFWDCPEDVKLKCPAYTADFGHDCWIVAGSFSTKACPKVGKEYNYCWECPWFKKCKPDFK